MRPHTSGDMLGRVVASDPRTQTVDTIRALAMDAVQKGERRPPRHGDVAPVAHPTAT